MSARVLDHCWVTSESPRSIPLVFSPAWWLAAGGVPLSKSSSEKITRLILTLTHATHKVKEESGKGEEIYHFENFTSIACEADKNDKTSCSRTRTVKARDAQLMCGGRGKSMRSCLWHRYYMRYLHTIRNTDGQGEAQNIS